MAKKSKNRRKQANSRSEREGSSDKLEGSKSVALTVAWMMCTLATGAALFLYAVFSAVLPRGLAESKNSAAAAIPAVALFTALVTGGLVLGLVPVVYRIRPEKPPLAITIGSLAVGSAPWIVLAINALR